MNQLKNHFIFADKIIIFLTIILIILSWLFPIYLAFRNTTLSEEISFYNSDHRIAWFQWARIEPGYFPWAEPILLDPSQASPLNLQLLIPNLFLFFINHIVPSPNLTWIAGLSISWLVIIILLTWLFTIQGYRTRDSLILSATSLIFINVISQIPPLTLLQMQFLINRLFIILDDKTFPYNYGTSVYYFSIPLFILSAILTVKMLSAIGQNTPEWKWLWAVTLAMFPFAYFYHAVQLLSLAPVMVLLTFRQHQFKLNQLKELALPFIFVGLVWVSFIIFHLLFTGNTTATQEHMLSIGLQVTRKPYLISGVLVRFLIYTLFSLIFYLLGMRNNLVYWMGYTIYGQSILLMNAQVIIGRTIQPHHFILLNPLAVTLMVIGASAYFLKQYAHRFSPAKMLVMTLLIVVGMSAYNFFYNLRAWNNVKDASRLSDEETELLQFFRENKPLKVILVDNLVIESLLLFENSNRSYLPWATLSIVDPIERMQRIWDAYEILNLQANGIELGQWLSTQSWHFFQMKYGTTPGYSSTLFFDPDTRAQVVAFRQDGIITESDLETLEMVEKDNSLHFRLDALILNQGDIPAPCLHGVDPVFYNNQFIVFSFPESCY